MASQSSSYLGKMLVVASVILIVSTTLIRPLLGLELPFHYYTSLLICLLIVSLIDRLLSNKNQALAVCAIAICFPTTLWLIDLCNKNPLVRDELHLFPTNLNLLFDLLSAPPVIFHALLSQAGLVPPWPIGVLLSTALLTAFWGLAAHAFLELVEATSSNQSLHNTKHSPHTSTRRWGKTLLIASTAIAFITRIHVLLRFHIPVGCDTPFYISTMQGRLPPEFYGGLLRHPLYAIIRTAGIVLDIPSPTLPLSQAYTVEIFPAALLAVIAATSYGLAYSVFKKPSLSFLASFLVITSLGILRVTWDLYKLLVATSLAITSLHLFYKSMEKSELRNLLLFTVYLALTIFAHVTAAGMVVLAALVYLVLLWVAHQRPLKYTRYAATATIVFLRTRRASAPKISRKKLEHIAKAIAVVVLLIALTPLSYWALDQAFKYVASGWYVLNVSSPWKPKTDGWAPVLHDIAVYNEVTLPLAALAVIYGGRKKPSLFATSLVISTMILLYNERLGIGIPNVGQVARLVSIAGIPLGVASAYGLVRVINPLLTRSRLSAAYAVACLTAVALAAGLLAHSYVYHGGLLPFITEPGLVATNWLMDKAPHPCNSKAPSLMDSWTGSYYGMLQMPVEKPYYYINPWEYECELGKAHQIYDSKSIVILAKI